MLTICRNRASGASGIGVGRGDEFAAIGGRIDHVQRKAANDNITLTSQFGQYAKFAIVGNEAVQLYRYLLTGLSLD